MAERLLEVKELKTYFYTDEGVVRAVDGVDLTIDKGETLGIVGESGCGKSVTALSIMRLIPTPPGRIVERRDPLRGPRTCSRCTDGEMRAIRGNEIAMIFQEPMTSLNPVFTVGEQIAEAVVLHQKLDAARGAASAPSRCCELVRHPDRRASASTTIPHQLSRRHAAARDDRDGAVLQPDAADRRRADDGARRDDPGADPRAARRAAARARAWRSCSSPTTWASSPRWPTGWP